MRCVFLYLFLDPLSLNIASQHAYQQMVGSICPVVVRSLLLYSMITARSCGARWYSQKLCISYTCASLEALQHIDPVAAVPSGASAIAQPV
ncbi:hypothetical protein BJ878DRAFT_498610 [Calycina marina]|uniref:Secreted protein n=1 Tax=Calycina marina TaxID=1763456 RepID=A0A9P7Z686_9HELO|nr:hypothetical protein BJ878DRAFT_498610 [Calycina marina]